MKLILNGGGSGGNGGPSICSPYNKTLTSMNENFDVRV